MPSPIASSFYEMGRWSGRAERQMCELYVIAACVIGGTSVMGGVGSIFGSLTGALIIGTLNAGAQQDG